MKIETKEYIVNKIIWPTMIIWGFISVAICFPIIAFTIEPGVEKHIIHYIAGAIALPWAVLGLISVCVYKNKH